MLFLCCGVTIKIQEGAAGMDIMHDRVFRIRRNLTDAGCSDSVINEYIELEKNHMRAEQYKLLGRQKSLLLKELHKDQYKIDCLDHMVYTLQEEDRKQTEEFK